MSRRVIGMNRAGSVWITPNELDIIAARRLWYRSDFRLEFSDPLRDAVVKGCRDRGMGLLPILIWERGRPTTADSWGQWHAYVTRTVKRYPGQHHWQVWNEPNNLHVPEWVFPTVEDWRHFVDDTARTIKAANPEASVMAGGIAVGGHGSTRPSNYFTSWFRMPKSVNRVAIHVYCSDAYYAAKAINNARRQAAQPVWCTELGRKSTVDGVTRQAAWFEGVRTRTGSTPLFWFDFQDPAKPGDTFDGFGACYRGEPIRGKPVWAKLVHAVGF